MRTDLRNFVIFFLGPVLSKSNSLAKSSTYRLSLSAIRAMARKESNKGEKAPKTATSSGSRKRKAKEKETEEVSDNDTRNFLTQLKNPKGDNVAEKAIVFEMYSGMSRFDAEKKELIDRWKKDKTCKWHQEYAHLRTKTEAVIQERMDGYGTKSPLCNCHFFYIAK